MGMSPLAATYLDCIVTSLAFVAWMNASALLAYAGGSIFHFARVEITKLCAVKQSCRKNARNLL